MREYMENHFGQEIVSFQFNSVKVTVKMLQFYVTPCVFIIRALIVNNKYTLFGKKFLYATSCMLQHTQSYYVSTFDLLNFVTTC